MQIIQCEACAGTGYILYADDSQEPCLICSGTGKLEVDDTIIQTLEEDNQPVDVIDTTTPSI